MYYVAIDAQGHWLALLLFSAAAKHLKHRDQWIGWTRAQCDRRLSLAVNNSRFLILPQAHRSNLGSRVLRLTLDRLSADWLARYGQPVLVVRAFVDLEQFNGTVCTAQGWQEVGRTDGWGRCRRDFCVQHDEPKRLFVREVAKNPRRSLKAEHLKPAWVGVEKKAGARGLTQHQRRALGTRPSPSSHFLAPSQSTFSRLLSGLDGWRLHQVLLEIQVGRKSQTVSLITDPTPDQLPAAPWLKIERLA